jgi:RND family efflux transporter MFP subunit
MLIFLVLPLIGCSIGTPEEAPTPTPIPTSIVAQKPTYTVQRGEVVEMVKFNGRIVPTVEQELFFRASGYVRKVYIKRGDNVKAGQVLADLEGFEDLERQRTSQKLNIRRAEIYVENAQQMLELFKLSTPTWTWGYKYELAIKENELELAQIVLDEASLSMQDLEETIADASIVAPFDGMILSLSIEEGRSVEAHKAVIVVADISQLEVSADIGDTELLRLETGMAVSIEPAGRGGQVYEGTIRRLPYSLTSGNTDFTEVDRTTRITLGVDPAEAELEMGDLVLATVILERKEDVLWLPPQAIRTFSGRRFVVVLKDGIQQRVDVQLGIESDERVEIKEGLSEGQVVMGP